MYRRFVLALALLLAPPVQAQTSSCTHADKIVEGAWVALSARPDIEGFRGARAGLDAAYLLLRYGESAPGFTDSVFSALEQGRRPHPQREDLRLTYDIWRLGPEEALARHPDPVAAVVAGWWSVKRAVILADGGVTFLQMMDEAAARDDLDPLFVTERIWAPTTAGYLTDQSDAFKSDLAARAQEAGYVIFAGFLLSDMVDQAPYFAFVDSLDDETADILWHPTHYGLSLSQGQDPISPPDAGEFDASRAIAAGRLMSPADFLLVTLNQTGEVEAVIRVVEQLAAAEVSGLIDPATDMEEAWLLAFDALLAELGAERTLAALSGFDLPSTRYRHYAGPGASGTIADMAAIQRLAPYAVGQGETLPDAHPALPYPAGWVEAAETLRSGRPVPTELHALAAELLFEAGNVEGAINMARITGDASVRESVLSDFIKRLDRRCEGATYFPMQALILGGDHMWDFP